MIVRRRKNGSASTIVQRTDGSVVETTLVIGRDALDCARHAGERIRAAMRSADAVRWNVGSGREIAVRRETDEYDDGDRYIRTRLVTASETGRDVRHAERRRENPSWEGRRECEVCHKRSAHIRAVRSEGAGRDMAVCAACRRIVGIANAAVGRSRASGSCTLAGGSDDGDSGTGASGTPKGA